MSNARHIIPSSFEQFYSALNPRQKEAVDTLDGPIMVIAGPGTGKTQVLALRIAHILRQKKTAAARILALTFSEAGVSAMRARLAEIIGTEGYYIPVHTFHGFCNELIREYPEEFSSVKYEGNIGELEQVQIIETLIGSGPYKLLRPFGAPVHYVQPAAQEINSLKREGIGPEELADRVLREEEVFWQIDDLYHEKGAHKGAMKGKYDDMRRTIEKNKELTHLYAAYQAHLQKNKQYDYNDMVMHAVNKLQGDETFQGRVAERYDYILVDEYQDTNTAQNRVLALLCSEKEHPNIFVVGDEKQAIFRFQGASLENFLYFHHLFPSAKIITLTENYRSTQPILDAAISVIGLRKKNIGAILPRVQETLAAKRGSVNPALPNIYEFDSPQNEQYFIAKTVKELLGAGSAPQEIAILVREHKDAPAIVHMLEKFEIPHVWESSSNMFDDYWAGQIIGIARFLVDFNEEQLLPVLHMKAFGISPLDIWKLCAYSASKERGAGNAQTHILEFTRDKNFFTGMSPENPEAIQTACALLLKWRRMAYASPVLELFEDIVRNSGIMEHLREQHNDPRVLSGAQALFNELKNRVQKKPDFSLADFIAYIELLKKYNVRVETKPPHGRLAAVRVMTAHASKGLEFAHVFIPCSHDAKWGGRKKPRMFRLPRISLFEETENERYEDERRIFFVAMSRARSTLHITHSKTNDEGREQVPSVFTAELPAELAVRKNAEPYERELSENMQIIFAPSRNSLVPMKQKDFVANLFLQRGLSVSALNNYIECPWKYLYVNLLRVPRAPSVHERYGTAVHDALHVFFSGAQNGLPKKEFLLEHFAQAIQRQPISRKDCERMMERGTQALGAYYDAYSPAWNTNTRAEFFLSAMMYENIRLNGKLDKLEIQPDGKSVVVVDYKTGKPKTIGEIEGATKNSRGNLKRQLVFYKLLLELHPSKKYRMEAGELDFVEPDARGKFHKERFSISNGEVTTLKEQISSVARDVISLAFWDKRCGDARCQWCALQENGPSSFA